jgi:hypothetical protein
MCRVFLKYLSRGTYEVLLLSSIIHVPGFDGTVSVMKCRGLPAKGPGIRIAVVQQTDCLRKTTSSYQLRKVWLFPL